MLDHHHFRKLRLTKKEKKRRCEQSQRRFFVHQCAHLPRMVGFPVLPVRD
jgi:hypothetical protein